MLFPLEEATEFIDRTAHLGVEEVQSPSTRGEICVFIGRAVSEEQRDAIRILARAKWPSRVILLGHRDGRAFVEAETRAN